MRLPGNGQKGAFCKGIKELKYYSSTINHPGSIVPRGSAGLSGIVFINITPAIKYLNIVIPAKAGIQVGTGCRIKSGMTELDYLIVRLIPGPILSLCIEFFQACFFYFLVNQYPTFIQAGIKIGFVTGEIVTLITKINLFFLVAAPHSTFFK